MFPKKNRPMIANGDRVLKDAFKDVGKYIELPARRAFLQRYHARTRPTAQSLWLGVAIEQTSDGDPQLRREYSVLLLSQFPNSDEARRLKPSK